MGYTHQDTSFLYFPKRLLKQNRLQAASIAQIVLISEHDTAFTHVMEKWRVKY